MKTVLRHYQKEASQAAVTFFLDKRNSGGGLLILPTAAGKSHVIADIAHRLNAPILIFCPSVEILKQNHEKMERVERGLSTMYSASVGKKDISLVTFATIGSVDRHPEQFDVFRYVLVDECFPYKQFVSTEKGQMRIGQLANMYKRGKRLPNVLSYNENTKECEAKKILRVWCSGVKEVFRYHFSGKICIHCTENHPFLTQDGWKAIGSLKEGEYILSNKKKAGYANIPNQDQIELILGSIIGDGSVEKRIRAKNTHRFRFTQGERQLEYLKWKEKTLGCEGAIYAGKSGYCDKNVYFFSSHVLYFKDEMCSKKYVIEHLSPKSLAVIWMDDGHLSEKQNGGSICAVAESSELTNLFAKKLNEMGIDCFARDAQSSSTKKTYHYIRLRKKGVEKLCKIVAPFVHKSMEYKLTDGTKHIAGSYIWDSTYSPYTACVLERKESDGEKEVFNMEVEDNHSYVITTGKYDKDKEKYPCGIIVHNCHNVDAKGGMYERFIHRRADRKVVGLTATPFRLTRGYEGGSILKFLTRTRPRIFDKVLYCCQVSDLLSQGYIADVTYYDVSEKTSFDISRVMTNSTGSDYDEESLKLEYERSGFIYDLFNWTVRVLNPKDGTKRNGVLVFTRFVKESEQLVRMLSEKGVCAAVVTGDTPKKERARIAEDFKKGKIKVIANSCVYIMGFDYPALDTVILASPTKSLARYYQEVGRIIRLYEGKKCWCVDLTYNYRRFGKVSDLKIGLEKPNSELWAVFSRGRKLTNSKIV